MTFAFKPPIIAFALIFCAAPVAQPERDASPSFSADTQSEVVRALETRFQAALIKERRLADDRELELIANAEDKLKRARQDFDEKISGAERALDRARNEYAQIVSSIAQREAAYKVELAAWREETLNLTASASPELQQAYIRFADGDQEAAYELIARLTQAQVQARMAAAAQVAASQVRQQAEFLNIMRIEGRGGATIADVLSIWDQAISLDPTDFRSHFERGALLADLGSVEKALEAVKQAEANARSAFEVFNVQILKGDLLWGMERWDDANVVFIDAYLYLDQHPEVLSDYTLSSALDRLGSSVFPGYSYDLMTLRELLEVSKANPRYSAAIEQTLRTLPTVPNLDSSVLEMAAEALSIVVKIEVEGSTGDSSSLRNISVALSRLAHFYAIQKNFEAANELLVQAYDLDKGLFDARPTRRTVNDLLVTIEMLGDIAVLRGDYSSAWSLMDEADQLDDLFEADAARDAWDVQAEISKLVRSGARSFLENNPEDARDYWTQALDTVHSNTDEFDGLATEAATVEVLLSVAENILRK
jgi:tetratricopeptide (TPR) repeat protein